MERIKQAIDKVRRQSADAKSPRATRPIMPRRTFQAMAGAEPIRYSQTKIVAVDAAHLERHRIVAYNKNDPMSATFDLLRTQVLRRMEEKGWRTLAVTSPVPGPGKTVVAVNLAMSIAHQTEKTAVLVDFDLRKPRVAEYLGLKVQTSLNDVFAGEAELHEAFYNPELPRLVVLPTVRPVPKPAELLASHAVESLIVELRERYDDRIVLFDLPPVLNADDVMAVAPHIDCVLLVVGNGECTKADIQESLRHLPGINLLGVVLNKAEVSRNRYY